MTVDGENVALEEVRRDIVTRDGVDAKQWEPLLRSGAAVVIDTTRAPLPRSLSFLPVTSRNESTRRRSAWACRLADADARSGTIVPRLRRGLNRPIGLQSRLASWCRNRRTGGWEPATHRLCQSGHGPV